MAIKVRELCRFFLRRPHESKLEYLSRTVAVGFCIVAVIFAICFTIIEMIKLEMCLRDETRPNKTCVNGIFYFAVALCVANTVIWFIVSRCCFHGCFYGCCFRVRKRTFRRILHQLENVPYMKKLDLEQPNKIVRHLTNLVHNTWVYPDHCGNDAKNLYVIHHDSFSIQYIFQINNKAMIKRYIKSHKKICDQHSVPPLLADTPIRTTAESQSGRGMERVLSDLSVTLAMQEVYDQPESVIYEDNTEATTSSYVTSAEIHAQPRTLAPTNTKIQPFGSVASFNDDDSVSGGRVAFSVGGIDDHHKEPELIFWPETSSEIQASNKSNRPLKQQQNTLTTVKPVTDHTSTPDNSTGDLSRHGNKARKSLRKSKRQKKMAASRRSSGGEALEIDSGITAKGEAYLFHGTRLRNVAGIIQKGFDIGQSKPGMFGKGIYLAESSQKADQYTDNPENRRSDFLPMFVVRTSLGKVGKYDPEKSKERAKKQTSGKVGAASSVEKDDVTATGDHTVVAGENKRFREFLKYDASQCYPEFLIIYNRERNRGKNDDIV